MNQMRRLAMLAAVCSLFAGTRVSAATECPAWFGPQEAGCSILHSNWNEADCSDQGYDGCMFWGYYAELPTHDDDFCGDQGLYCAMFCDQANYPYGPYGDEDQGLLQYWVAVGDFDCQLEDPPYVPKDYVYCACDLLGG